MTVRPVENLPQFPAPAPRMYTEPSRVRGQLGTAVVDFDAFMNTANEATPSFGTARVAVRVAPQPPKGEIPEWGPNLTAPVKLLTVKAIAGRSAFEAAVDAARQLSADSGSNFEEGVLQGVLRRPNGSFAVGALAGLDGRYNDARYLRDFDVAGYAINAQDPKLAAVVGATEMINFTRAKYAAPAQK